MLADSPTQLPWLASRWSRGAALTSSVWNPTLGGRGGRLRWARGERRVHAIQRAGPTGHHGVVVSRHWRGTTVNPSSALCMSGRTRARTCRRQLIQTCALVSACARCAAKTGDWRIFNNVTAPVQ